MDNKVYFIDPLSIEESFNSSDSVKHILYHPEDMKNMPNVTCGNDHHNNDLMNLITNTRNELGS